MEPLQLALVVPWVAAAALALRFGMGNARAWSSMAVGVLLIPISELMPVVPYWLPGPHASYVAALGHVVGMVAMLTMHHSLQDYFAFTLNLDERGDRLPLGLAMAGAIGAGLLLLVTGPEPTVAVRRALHLVENTNWLFLALIDIGLIRRIRSNLGDAPVSGGFFALAVVFACIALWKGSELYLGVYQFDLLGGSLPGGFPIVRLCGIAGNILAGIGASVTFIYLARLLR